MERNIQNHDIMELSYISENGAFDPHIFPIFEKVTFGAQIKKNGMKKVLASQETERSYISLKKVFFLYFGRGIFRTIAYLEHYQNFYDGTFSKKS